ncbi:MAG: sugar phosphate isomerase/epimerase, partial [Planctomycetales bacterium]|nr:sugar phosphate isomerase/epimerase [Planctomycetales bacterium]
SVALTIDHGLLNPLASDWRAEAERYAAWLQEHHMRSVVETGARFLLDARQKHEPTLLTGSTEGRQQRVEFTKRAIDIAQILGSDCVSLWSGVLREELSDEEALERLCEGLGPIVEYAEAAGVVLGFEPEPGMFVATVGEFERLCQWISSDALRLTMDIGHLYCQGEVPIADYIRRWGDRIVNVHIEDMRAGEHVHLMFGEGEIWFPPIIEALTEVGYAGGLHVELSRHSHEGVSAVRRAYDFLRPLMVPDREPPATS